MSLQMERDWPKWADFAFRLTAAFSFSKLSSYRDTSPGFSTAPAQGAGTSSGIRDRLALVARANFSRFGLGPDDGVWVSSYMGGVRHWFQAQPAFLPFVQATVGIENSFGESAFAFEPAGGVIFPVGRWHIVAEAGFRRAAYEGAASNSIFFGGGLAIPLAR
jgi:hypothetical protein